MSILKGQELFIVSQFSEDVPVRKLRETRPSFSIFEVKERFVRTVEFYNTPLNTLEEAEGEGSKTIYITDILHHFTDRYHIQLSIEVSVNKLDTYF